MRPDKSINVHIIALIIRCDCYINILIQNIRRLFVKIQLDDDETIVVKYFVRSVPTFLYFEDGELKDRIIGSVSAEELRKYVKDKL